MRKILIILALALWSLPALSVYHDGVLYLKTNVNEKTCHIEEAVDVGDTLVIPPTVMFDDTEYRVTEIRKRAFYESSLKVVSIPSTVELIGESAFGKCTSLVSVEFSNGLVSIGDYAFEQCISLAGLELPESVTSLGNAFLLDCSSITGIKVDEGSPYFTEVDGVLFSKDMSRLIVYPGARGGSYTVPSSVQEIGSYAFCDNRSIEAIGLPPYLTLIGAYAFSNCNLTEIEFPKSLKKIGERAFYNCSFKEVAIPESVKILDKFAFSFNIGLQTVRIYGEFDEVSDPFWGCDAIMEVYYITDDLQVDNGKYVDQGGHQEHSYYYYPGCIDWGFLDRERGYDKWQDKDRAEILYPEATLYVLHSVYGRVKDETLSPWSFFNDVKVYDPTDDPYFNAVDEVMGDKYGDPELPVTVYTLGGVKVGSSTDGLPAGLYILRRGSRSEKIVVR